MAGITERQMRTAPYGAIYILCNDVTQLARQMAKELGRDDLVIKGLSYLESNDWRGVNKPVIVDHAAVAIISSRGWDKILKAHTDFVMGATK